MIENAMEYERNVGQRYKTGTSCSDTCTFSETRFFHFVKELSFNGLWPVTRLDFHNLDSRLEVMKELHMDAPKVAGCESSSFNHCCVATKVPPSYAESRDRIRNKALDLVVEITDICYECAMIGEVATTMLCGHGSDHSR